MESYLTPIELAVIPAESRADVDRWHAEFQAVRAPVTKSLEQLAGALGTSYATVVRRYYAWKRYGPRALVNVRDNPDFGLVRRGAFAQETFDFYHTLCLQNGRKSKPAYRKLTQMFFAGEMIPGVPPETPRTHLPCGWNYPNFQRHAPSAFEARAARVGIKAAAEFRPLVFTSRVGLEVMQFVMFDDVWHDFEVVVLGRRERCRLLQLHAHDLFSACQFARGIKPRVRKDDDSATTGLTLQDMIFLVCHVLGRFGHNPNGTTMVLEAGTATLPGELMDQIKRLSGGKVKFHVGEVRGERAFAGQYLGRGKGNFRLKASLESSHNLLHNQTADLLTFPGQVGSNARLNAPEELHGRQKEADKLLLCLAALPPDVVQKLQFSFLEVSRAIWAVQEVCEMMNRRGSLPWWNDHDLEGWVEAGLTTTDFCLPGIGTITHEKFMSLDEPQRNAVVAVAQTVARKLSPREVFDAGARNLRRWRNEEMALLLWHARREEPVTVGKNHLVEFQDKSISPAPMRFLAHHFAPGTKFECTVNPLDPRSIYIYDAQGRWLGMLDHWGAVRRDDSDGLARQMGRAEAVKNELLAPVRDTALTVAKIAREENNNRVIQEHLGRIGADHDLAREALMMD